MDQKLANLNKLLNESSKYLYPIISLASANNIELIDDCNRLYASVSENSEKYNVSIMQGITIEVIQGKPDGQLIFIE